MLLGVLMLVVLLSVANGRSAKDSLLPNIDIGCRLICQQRYLSCIGQSEVQVEEILCEKNNLQCVEDCIR